MMKGAILIKMKNLNTNVRLLKNRNGTVNSDELRKLILMNKHMSLIINFKIN